MATEGQSHIPVIDFLEYGPGSNLDPADSIVLHDLGSKVKDAFQSVGFCYIKNHGIADEIINNHFATARAFFSLPTEVKQRYARLEADRNFGWVSTEREQLNPERPADLKEAFDFHPPDDINNWPPEVEGFQEVCHLTFEKCSELARRIFRVLSIGLGLDDAFLSETHKLIGQTGNKTCLRSLHYPPIVDGSCIKPGQIRLSEHSDYGSITILLQDDIGGLEVEIPGVGFVPATPIPGTVVVNIGDLMQRWTADQLTATRHRVLIPEVELLKRSPRQSMAFFVQPDDDVMIHCLGGSNKYEAITSLDYLNSRFDAVYLV